MKYTTHVLSVLACVLSLLSCVEMQRDYSSPYNDPCGGSATMAHSGDIAMPFGAVSDNRAKRGATSIRERLWPDARIPYRISSRYTTEERNRILTAIRTWEERTCVRFYERPSDHTASYINIFKGAGCCSFVGRQTENLQQGVSLAKTCMKFSTILHELGHAIGFWHEQSRPDRDEYIRVLTENIASSQRSNFQIEEEINSLGVGYDYNSVMHYNNDTFGGGRLTIVAHDPTIPVGRAVELSELDILQANLLYQCGNDTKNHTPIETPLVLMESTTPPPLPECSTDFVGVYYGNFSSPGYPIYSHNQNCVYRIIVPDGMTLTVTLVDLNLEWSPYPCEKDGLTIYRTVDGTGEPQRYPVCGSGRNMVTTMDTNVAYVSFHTDGDNIWEGYRGFYATFNAEDIDECQEHNGGCSQHCHNLVGGYQCTCDHGWSLSGDSKTCFDINECALGNGGCQYKCRNSGGSFTCKCPEGTVLNADGKTCSNSETTCDVDNGGCDHVCSEDSPTGVSCHCRSGYRLISDGVTCLDINECVEGNTCSYGGCRNTPGSYNCVCHHGYEAGPENTCINMDECSRGLHGCEGECRDTDGSYECSCPPGLRLSDNGHDCTDIDECQDSSVCSHTCINEYGSYECVCPVGYELHPTAADNCVDIDECSEGLDNCEHGCSNTDGSFVCTCNAGYTLTSNGYLCTDIDECLEGACSGVEGATCLNTDGSYKCQCNAGYRNFSNGQTCEDIDECLEGACSGVDEATCLNTNGSYECQCNAGYRISSDGQTCEDINECSEGLDNCEHGCSNTDGLFVCTCNAGYTLTSDGYLCTDIDECLEGACTGMEEATCFNTDGSYECQCNAGYRNFSNGQTCEDIDECLEGACSGVDEATCLNTNGSYKCQCNAGYRISSDGQTCEDINECSEGLDNCEHGCSNTDGLFVCTCNAGYTLTSDGYLCTDIDECLEGACSGVEGATCLNTDGSYECQCNAGYRISSDGQTCEDIDECSEGLDNCEHGCSNTDGSFVCTCNAGYTLASDGCIDIDECLEGACSGVEGATCLNTDGSYECQCNAGYRISSDGQTCEDIDECSEGLNNCEHGCSNTEGSFVCTCNAGYTLASDGYLCKCGARLTEPSGSFSSPGWPNGYPHENFQCEWIIDLPDPDATIQFTIDDSAYGINGRSPCPTDYIIFFDGIDANAPQMYKLCKFDRPDPFTTSSSQARVVFSGTAKSNRPVSRVGVRVIYSTVTTATPSSTSSTTSTPSSTTSTPSSTTSTPSSTTSSTTSTPSSTSSTTSTPSSTSSTTSTPSSTTSTPSSTTSTPSSTSSTTSTPTSTTPSSTTSASSTTSTPSSTTSTVLPIILGQPIIVGQPTPILLIDECIVNNGGCDHNCVDTDESYYCECDPGYTLNNDGKTCRCGGVLTDTQGSFQTPGWPYRYPQIDLQCEWTVIGSSSSREVRFTVDREYYGINGRWPCSTDYLQFFRGLDQPTPVGPRYCFIRAPRNVIYVPGAEATIIFKGTKNNRRPASRVGVKVYYSIL